MAIPTASSESFNISVSLDASLRSNPVAGKTTESKETGSKALESHILSPDWLVASGNKNEEFSRDEYNIDPKKAAKKFGNVFHVGTASNSIEVTDSPQKDKNWQSVNFYAYKTNNCQ